MGGKDFTIELNVIKHIAVNNAYNSNDIGTPVGRR